MTSNGFRSSQVSTYEMEEHTDDQSRYDRDLLDHDQQQQQQSHQGHSAHPSHSRRSASGSQPHLSSQSAPPPSSVRRPSSSGGRRTGSTSGTPQLSSQQQPSSSSSNQLTVPGSSQRHSRGMSAADQASEMHKNFKVVVRIRPPLPRELDGMRAQNGVTTYRDIVRTEERNRAVSICENGVQSKDGYNTTTITNADGTLTQSTNTSGGIYASHKFTFDYVYDQDAQQVDVYKNTAREAVLSTLQGYNATILAYGQTGTGKTFTMEGFDDTELRGIIPRSVEEIFNYIQNTAHTNVRFLVRASYLQIYNEVISDLLKPERSNLSIREGQKKGVYVEGLSEWVVRSPKEVYGLIKRGTSLRATGSTRINETSSRSHALFIIIVEQNEMIYEEDQSLQGGQGQTQGMDEQEKARTIAGASTLVRQSFKVGKLNLVDLAGSERVRISGAKGRRLEESKYINQSLSALGNVISALTEGNRQHIPYRDSKLTRILEDSFGGNVKCTLLAMISPAQEAFLESLSTLKFANRAKNIKNEAKINEDLDEKALLRRYERELKKLRQELQAKSKNVVDKRKLIEVEEQRRRAEQDKMTALMNMERLSRDLLTEKNQKKKLEERIKEMNSQLLVGGHLNTGGGAPGSAADAVESQKAFQQALQVEQDRIRQQYSQKLQELEKEREQMEEEKAQTSRYKQLLLKQRDIMIQLTARLNERDQSILLLQEELDAYDKHQRAMEDELDQKRHRLIQLQRMNVGTPGSSQVELSNEPSSPSAGGSSVHANAQNSNLYGLFPIDEAPYFEEHSLSPLASPSPTAIASSTSSSTVPTNGAQSYLPQSASSAIAKTNGLQSSSSSTYQSNSYATPNSPIPDAAAIEAEISRRVALELARRDSHPLSSSASSSVALQQVNELTDTLQRKESETLRLREELERLRRQPQTVPGGVQSSSQEVASLSAALKNKEEYVANLSVQNANLLQNVTALQMLLQSEKQATATAQLQVSQLTNAPHEGDKVLRESFVNLRKKYDIQLQERAALKVILEKKMKALIDSIANTTLHGGKSTSSTAAGTPNSPQSTNPNQIKDALPSRTKREIEVLQRLVEASLTALKNSDVKDEESTNALLPPSSTPRQPPPPSPMGSTIAATSTPSSATHRQQLSFGSTPTNSATPSNVGSIPVRSALVPSSAVPPRPSLHPSSTTASVSGPSSSLGIEQQIAQRKQELQRLDERLR